MFFVNYYYIELFKYFTIFIAENFRLASTPLPGSASTPPAALIVTPIGVKYERMRSELSATKKQQQKLESTQEVGVQ